MEGLNGTSCCYNQVIIFRLDGEIGRGYRLQTRVEEAGTWHYCLVNNEKKLPGGTIQVPPNLRLREKTLTPDQIILQTLVSKWMGTIEEWGPHLKAASESGYNMIHFTPLQRRGHSNSPYSIYNHHEIDPGIFSSSTLQDDRLTRLQETIKWMENELGLLSMIDVVWNHTACDSPWLADHPEAGYTLENSPHLKIAYELDESILRFSASMQEGYHLAPQVNSEADVKGILEVFSHNVLPELALWEYFVVDVSSAVLDLEAIFRKEAASSPSEESPESHTFSLEDAVINDCQYDRHSRKMNVTMVREYFRERLEEYRRMPNESDRSLLLSRVLSEYRLKLDQINYTQYQQYDSKVQLIIHNLTNRMIYERVADHGPKLGPISATSPIVPTYFTRIPKPDGSGIYAFANNGWIWDADPLLNFADPTSDAYFTREVIVWGDCVKLRYGSKPDDSPWLWEFMGKYTAMMATTFHGFRIDNCHSTPLHVANGLLSVARRVRPDLYVCAELFTGSEERDMLFVTRLGLNSLIREAMVAWDTSELGRTTSRYGGQPVGAPFDRPEFIDDGNQTIYGILQSQPHALYMDCTHDNEAPAQRRTAADALSNLAIVAFSTTAIGSVRGYDELVPTYLNLVNEARHYQIPDRATGLWDIRRQLNIIHNKIVEEGMFEIVVEQDYDLLIIRRTNPVTLETLLLLARTAFNHSDAQPTCICSRGWDT